MSGCVPVILVEEAKQPLEGAIQDGDLLAVALLDLVAQEQSAVRIVSPITEARKITPYHDLNIKLNRVFCE
jgi:hypothetical protein